MLTQYYSTLPIFPAFGHVATAVPYTYRDGLTLLEKIECITRNLQQAYDSINDVVNDINNTNDQVGKQFTELRDATEHALQEMQENLVKLIQSTVAKGDGIYWNPVYGTQSDMQTIMNDMYDNVRVHALFARDYDMMELTAAEYDTTAGTARNYDLHASRIIDAEIGDYLGRDDYFTAIPEKPDTQENGFQNFLTREEASAEYMTLHPDASQFEGKE